MMFYQDHSSTYATTSIFPLNLNFHFRLYQRLSTRYEHVVHLEVHPFMPDLSGLPSSTVFQTSQFVIPMHFKTLDKVLNARHE